MLTDIEKTFLNVLYSKPDNYKGINIDWTVGRTGFVYGSEGSIPDLVRGLIERGYLSKKQGLTGPFKQSTGEIIVGLTDAGKMVMGLLNKTP